MFWLPKSYQKYHENTINKKSVVNGANNIKVFYPIEDM